MAVTKAHARILIILYTMLPDGTDKALLYPSEGSNNDWWYQKDPVWGDHGQIVFSEMITAWNHWELGVINDDGSGRYLIPHPGADSVRANSWTYDGSKIVYHTNR